MTEWYEYLPAAFIFLALIIGWKEWWFVLPRLEGLAGGLLFSVLISYFATGRSFAPVAVYVGVYLLMFCFALSLGRIIAVITRAYRSP